MKKNNIMIKLLVMDVDGTLTDGKIYVGNDGELFKAFNVKDGYAITNILANHNIIPAIITGRQSRIVEKRCQELKISYFYQGCENKLLQLKALIYELGLSFENVAYIGDDLNDIDCMSVCALNGCPNDAIEKVKELCDFISKKSAGEGAVREFIDWIIS